MLLPNPEQFLILSMFPTKILLQQLSALLQSEIRKAILASTSNAGSQHFLLLSALRFSGHRLLVLDPMTSGKR